MLVETKAKVGVFAIALGAYLPQFPTLVPEFETQYDAFKKTIPDTVEMIDGGIVTTKELSMEAGDKFRAADVDLVILQLLTYATSYNMLPAVRDLNVPVVLVNVQKRKAPDYANTDTPKWLGELYACGAVGEMVADLERAGKRHAVITGVVEGGDAYVAKEIDEWCRAAQVRRRFRYTNIAQIGRPYPGMMDLYIDETNLYNRMGLYTKQFDWEKMWAIADPVTDEAAIRAKAEEILDTFDIEGGATVETVWDMAKYVVAFEEWVKKEDLGMVASHYDGFAKGVAGKLDSMLIPAFSMLIKQGTACAVEGDMKVAMAMSILKTIAGTGQLSEMYSIDFNEDICIIGHLDREMLIFRRRKTSMKIVDVFMARRARISDAVYPPVGDVTYLGITQDKDGHFKLLLQRVSMRMVRSYLWRYKHKMPALPCLAGLEILLSMLLFTRIQNTGSHQMLLFLPGWFLLFLLGAAALAEGISRFRAAKVVFWVFTLVFATSVRCSPLTTIALPGFLVDHFPLAVTEEFVRLDKLIYDRRDLPQIKAIANWIDTHCAEGEISYMIPHDMLYCPDHFKNCQLPATPINDKLAFGFSVPGTHNFPMQFFEAKYVLTADPFPQTFVGNGEMSHKLNERFLAVRDEYFALEATFDMGNGTTFTIWRRTVAPTRAEVEYYLSAFKEEDAQYPEMFSQIAESWLAARGL